MTIIIAFLLASLAASFFVVSALMLSSKISNQ